MKKRNIVGTAVLVIATMLSVPGYAGGKPVAIEAKEYKVVVETKGDNVEISTQGQGGYHCNTLYPWKLTVSGEKGEKVYKKDAAATFGEKMVKFVASKSDGKSGVLKLSVCNEQQCVMKTEKISFQ